MYFSAAGFLVLLHSWHNKIPPRTVAVSASKYLIGIEVTVIRQSGDSMANLQVPKLVFCTPAHTASLITSSAVPTLQGQAVQGQNVELIKRSDSRQPPQRSVRCYLLEEWNDVEHV